jgi:fucose 4-O-acetylase-like acetyltransferase
LSWVDYAKGIGIILVVLGHVIRGVLASGMAPYGSVWSYIDKFIYGFHMPLFFFLSGLFVYKWVSKNPVNFSNKIKTILYPYVVWSIIQGMVNIILSSFTNNPLTINELIMSILVHPYGQFWFLYVLFIFFVLSVFFLKRFNVKLTLILSLIAFFLSSLIPVMVLSLCAKYFFFFILGSFYMQSDIKIGGKRLFYVSTGLFIFSNLIYLPSAIPGQVVSLVTIYLSMIGIVFVISLSKVISEVPSFSLIKSIGLMSMVIFLAHTLSASGFRILVEKLLDVHNPFIHILLGTLIGIIAPIMFFKITNKLKVNTIFFGK